MTDGGGLFLPNSKLEWNAKTGQRSLPTEVILLAFVSSPGLLMRNILPRPAVIEPFGPGR